MEIIAHYFQFVVDYLVILIDKIGYAGIFIGMFLESTIVPIPSEAIMIPAGIAVTHGKFDLFLVILIGVIGNTCGAIFNYSLAYYYGRPILLKIGKLFFVGEETIRKIEVFFDKHGAFSTFTGRLIPGVRHYISLPAGVAKMNFRKFCFYTFVGALIWISILANLGILIGHNEELIKEYLAIAIIGCLLFCLILGLIYIWFMKVVRNNN